jgi:site-specific DNA-cytosine methylase
VDSPKTITAISLCSGYEGLGLGLRRVLSGLRVIAYSEIEAYACANLVSKMEAGLLDAAPVWSNLTTFPCEQFHGLVDIITGGYPCQPESCAGKKMGKEDSRWIWPYIRRAVHVIRPSLCFFENVEGHITGGLRSVLTDLSALGYRVANSRGEPTWGIFSAAEVGAPHRRKRVFILAYRKDFRGDSSWTANQLRRAGAFNGSGEQLADAESGRESGRTVGRDGWQVVGRSEPDMADTTQRRFRELREPSGSNGQPDGGDQQLGHAASDDQRRNTMPGIDGQRIEAGGSGWPMDNTASPRCDDAGQRSNPDSEGGKCVSGAGCGELADTSLGFVPKPGRRSVGRTGVGPTEPGLAEPESVGLQVGRGQRGDIGQEQPSFNGSCLPEFPPKPNDAAAWALAPKELWPATVKPAVRILADGLSSIVDAADRYRVDALRAAGNGVVPATAAKAFRVLLSRIT